MQPGFRSTLLALLLVPALALGQAKPIQDPDALERSLNMLHIEWKLNVLETYYAQARFYIPATWPNRLQDEYRKLAAEAGSASDARLKNIDQWLEASRENDKNETLEMYKLVEERIGKLAKALKDEAEGKKLAMEWDSYKLGTKKTALEVARFMEGMTSRVRLVNKGPESDPSLAEFSRRWEENARRIYRGSIADTDSLITSIAQHENTRKQIETRLAYLKGVEEALEWSSAVRGIIDDPSGKAVEKLEEFAQAKALEWMKSRYHDIDDAAFKKTWGDAKGILTEVASLRETLKGYDEDPALRQNPTALSMVRKCALIGAIYKQTLGQLKKLPGAQIAGPLFDVLDFYGQVLGMVPEIARRMLNLVDKTRQGHKIGALDVFSVVKEAQLLWEDQRMRDLGLQIAVDTQTDETSPQARYYMIVPREVIPRGYATFTRDEYLKLCESIAYERFINAPKEAWRGPYNWAKDFVFGDRNTDVTSANVSTAYLDELSAKSKKTPFTPADLIALAQGKSVSLGDRTWNHQTLAEAADSELDTRASEMLLRKSTGKTPSDVRAAWYSYLALLRQHQVALSPQQILNLFSHYQGSDNGAAHVSKYLDALSKERVSRERGVPAVGVPVILLPKGPTVEAGKTTNLTADVIVSNMAAGREVDGTARWELPKWAPPVPDQPVKIRNGINQVTSPLTVPKGIDLKPFEVKVKVTFPADDGENAVARAAAAASDMASGVNAVTTLPPHEKPGANDFGIDVPEPGAPVIALRRKQNVTVIDVRSDALSALKEDSDNAVLLTLYYSETQAGPFKKASETGQLVSRLSSEINPNNVSGWIDKDTFAFAHHIYQTEGVELPRKPLFYQVTQSRATAFGEPVGKETRSNIAGSNGKATIQVSEEIKDGILQATRSGEWWYFKVALAVEDQGIDIQGAHAIVTCGTWTGHFFTARREGRFAFGAGESIAATGSAVNVKFPVSGGNAVKVAISGEGFSASASYQLPDTKEDAQRGKQNAEAIRQQAERYVKGSADALKAARERLAFHTEKRKEKHEMNTFLQAHTWGGVGMAGLAAEVRRQREYAGPYARASGAADAAAAEGNYAAALAASNELINLVKVQTDIRREEIQAEIAERQAVLAVPGESGSLRKHYETEVKRLTEAAADLPRGQAVMLSGLYEQQARLALLAGDGGAYQQARKNQLQAFTDGKVDPTNIPSLLFTTADDVAVLTGSQSEAAALWNEAWQKLIAVSPADYRAQRQADFAALRSFPGYLPAPPKR